MWHLQSEKSYFTATTLPDFTWSRRPRATRDFDFVVNLQPKHVQPVIDFFKEGYYCSEEAVKDAVHFRGMFNIIDHASGFKADFVVLKNQPFRLTEFERRIQADFFGIPIFIVTPEDLLLSKLIWIQELQSSIQMEDIKNLKELDNLDWNYIDYWITSLKLNTFGLLNE